MLRVEYKDEPYRSNETAVYEAEAQAFCTKEFYTGTAQPKYATTEPDLWALDGTFEIMPDEPTYTYWSPAHSDKSGKFSERPTITIDLSPAAYASGITLYFDIDPCDVAVRWYSGNSLINQGTFSVDSLSYTCQQTVSAFDKVTITFVKTSKPERFVKMNRIVVGQNTTFGEDEIEGLSAYFEVSPISSELPGATLDLDVIRRSGLVLNFQRMQEMRLYKDDELQGIFYVTEGQRNGLDMFTVSCDDAVGWLGSSRFMGGLYTDKPAKELIDEIIAGEYPVDYTLIPDSTVTGYLHAGTRKEALQQVAFAIGCFITTYGTGTIKFFPKSGRSTRTAGRERVFTGGSAKQQANTSEYRLTAHNYVKDTEMSDAYSGTLESGTETTVTLESPFSDFTVAEGDAEILDSGANYITLKGSGEVKISGYAYKDNPLVRTHANPRSSLLEKANVEEVTDATLISAKNVTATLERMRAFGEETAEELSADIILQGEKPGDMITLFDRTTNSYIVGTITAFEINYGAQMDFASIKVAGKPLPANVEYIHSGEVQAGEVWL